MSLAAWISEWLPVLWFVLAAAIILYLWDSGTLGRLFDRVTKVGGFGLSFEFTKESAQQTRATVEEGLGAVRTAISRRLAADVRQYGLQDALQSVVDQTQLKGKKGVRATVHIPDPLYENQLYQLLDYYPKGGGSGRTFSTRSGIIGLAWRTWESKKWHQNSVDQAILRQMWGMTREEAETRETADKSKLFLAIPLYNPKHAVVRGVFYLDATDRKALGLLKDPVTEEAEAEADALLDALRDEIIAAYGSMMAEPLDELVQAALDDTPQINLESR